jgi:FkbM family methyltransferase
VKKINNGISIDVDDLMKEINPTICILDVGCAESEERKIFRKYFAGPIYFFEADYRWEEELSIIEKEDNCFVERVAVNNYNGKITFYKSYFEKHPDRPSHGSTIKPLMMSYSINFKGEDEVSCITLDSWAEDKDIDVVDLMWVDVEGAERNVFEGGKNIIKKTRYIYFEYCHLPYADGITLPKLLDGVLKDFSIFYIDKMNVLCKNKKIK